MNALVYPVVAVAAAIGMYFFYFTGEWEQVQARQVEIQQFEKGLTDMRLVSDKLRELDGDYQSLSRQDLERLEKFLPRDFDKVRSVNNLKAVFDEAEVPLSIKITEQAARAVAADDPTAYDPVRTKQTIDLNFETDYETFQSLLESIETTLQVANVESLIVERGSLSDDDDEVQSPLIESPMKISMSLVYYTFNLPDIQPAQ